MSAELDGMVGRLKIEVQAIIGFARLTSGDQFEVSIKHGTQKWKTRGKTQPDRTQRWESTSQTFTCYPDHLFVVKVSEVRMIKSKVLSERHFDPTKFFAPQPLLVTMNLNSIGSLKLKFVVSWLPLITTQIQKSTTTDLDFRNNNHAEAVDSETRPRVCLREKKRGRQVATDGKWRSSTNILDSVYKDLSRSIPTIDDLTAFPAHQRSESAAPRTAKPQLGTSILNEEAWTRSISMNQLKCPTRSHSDDDSSGVSSAAPKSSASSIQHSPPLTHERVDLMLQFVERLRVGLAPLQANEWPEIAGFEVVMLNWEALLKLNRAVLVEQTRGQRSTNRLVKRSSIYVQHSPQSDEHNFENDSGIDSLRQAKRFHHTQMASDSTTCGPSQRRFRQIRERRRSLGFGLDDPTEFFNSQKTATGNAEIDLCLEHHFVKSITVLEELKSLRGPMEYRLNDLLNQLEQNTIALEELMRITKMLPAIPNIGNLLIDLGADQDQQETWLSTVYPMGYSLMVPMDRLRVNLQTIVAPIVQSCYPNLINKVVDSLLQLINNKTNGYVSIFEFVACFQSKHTASFIENLAHESYIIDSLESRNSAAVRDIMKRLQQVPIVPPVEALRHIGLAIGAPECQDAIRSYLKSASNFLQTDLAAAFINLLEHKDPETRIGACRALAILCNETAIESLEFLAVDDSEARVKSESRKSIDRIRSAFADYQQEITKI
ncbi:hypothetical protein M3Y94_00939900 [Aphelenchoides besseyi]|nr:hypothetical protein M3Y94_00939900 [Aphelenchoides besseyi]